MRWTHDGADASLEDMKLFFSPLACSLASRIAIYETGTETEFVQVDGRTKLTADGLDYRTVHPLGLVPALRLDDGELLTESAAVLQYLSRRAGGRLAPPDDRGQARLQEWLAFVSTELHKGCLGVLLDPRAPAEAKAHALTKAEPLLAFVDTRLQGRDTLLEGFSIADAYLFAVLNWTTVLPIELARWPAVADFMKRMHARPHVARAFAEERALFLAEQARR